MKCPLFVQVLELKGGLYDSQAMNCLKEECAWWSKSMKACCVPVLAANLMGLNETMLHLVDKMPTELQFRK